MFLFYKFFITTFLPFNMQFVDIKRIANTIIGNIIEHLLTTKWHWAIHCVNIFRKLKSHLRLVKMYFEGLIMLLFMFH